MALPRAVPCFSLVAPPLPCLAAEGFQESAMRLTPLLATVALSIAPAAAAHDVRDGGPRLATDLVFATERLHDRADRFLRPRGGYGHAAAGTLHRMDEWAGYYQKAVMRDGFYSRKAELRFQRFLVEYRDACAFLEHGRPGPEVALLHSTVDRLSAAYGTKERWEDDRWDQRRRRR